MILFKYSITDGILKTAIAMKEANENYDAAHKVWVKGMMNMRQGKYTNKNISVSYLRAKKKNDLDRIMAEKSEIKYRIDTYPDSQSHLVLESEMVTENIVHELADAPVSYTHLDVYKRQLSFMFPYSPMMRSRSFFFFARR